MSKFTILHYDGVKTAISMDDFSKEVEKYVDQGFDVKAGNYDFENNRAWVMVLKRETAAHLPSQSGNSQHIKEIREDQM